MKGKREGREGRGKGRWKIRKEGMEGRESEVGGDEERGRHTLAKRAISTFSMLTHPRSCITSLQTSSRTVKIYRIVKGTMGKERKKGSDYEDEG